MLVGVGQGDSTSHPQPYLGEDAQHEAASGCVLLLTACRSGEGRELKWVLPPCKGVIEAAATTGSRAQPNPQPYTIGKMQIWSQDRISAVWGSLITCKINQITPGLRTLKFS